MTYITNMNENELLQEMLKEQEMMKNIIKDLLHVCSKDHPDLIFKYMNYFKVDESHLYEIPDHIEKVDIF